jgi:hypothetical protein
MALPAFKKVLEENATTKKPASKKAKGMPVLDNAPSEVKESVDHYVKHKKLMKEAKAEMDAASDVIIEYGENVQDDRGFEGDFSKSYKIHGNEEEVSFVSSNKHSLNADDEETLKALLGKHFNQLIEEVFSVNLKPEVLESEELQNELMELIGNQFSKFFTTVKSLKVADDFDKNIYTLLNKTKLNNVRSFVKKAKPSLR